MARHDSSLVQLRLCAGGRRGGEGGGPHGAAGRRGQV